MFTLKFAPPASQLSSFLPDVGLFLLRLLLVQAEFGLLFLVGVDGLVDGAVGDGVVGVVRGRKTTEKREADAGKRRLSSPRRRESHLEKRHSGEEKTRPLSHEEEDVPAH